MELHGFYMSDKTAQFQVINKLEPQLQKKIEQQGTCEVNAVLIGKQINLRSLTRKMVARAEPIIALLENDGIAIIYHFGAIVFFNAGVTTTAKFITLCQQHTKQLLSDPETEKLELVINSNMAEGIIDDQVSIKEFSKEHLEIISDALAKSIVLDHHEHRISWIFEKIEPIAKTLQEKGQLGVNPKDLLKQIGSNLMMAQEMAGRIEVTEKPAVLWENTQLEPLHAYLVEDLEIIDRQEILNRKLELISNTAEISLEVLQTKHGHRLEWYIIILIAIEIGLQLYEMFFSKLH